MSEQIRIVSDGISLGTRVLNADGTPIPGVAHIELLPIKPFGIVEARITFLSVELDMVAAPTAMESNEQAEDTQA
ncbi:hypothetical protein C7401_13633 [Paraburkholderia unamae]|uniref:hypothetical protein n=1 Tax=Paraburkholderia unamae TaxID=219649 RepID=UPI000DC3BA90|nr:hypothetical protein [Paraburkholderia unamae]RAR51673.1 hypothetical protein C7401_13633 [Paraburkholderia unamae]